MSSDGRLSSWLATIEQACLGTCILGELIKIGAFFGRVPLSMHSTCSSFERETWPSLTARLSEGIKGILPAVSFLYIEKSLLLCIASFFFCFFFFPHTRC